MPDGNGTEATRSDAPSVQENTLADAVDDKAAAVTEEEVSKSKAEQDAQGADNAREQAASTDDLKVVVSIKGGRATIGAQRPSSDPHIESFDDHDLPALAQEVAAVTERARAKWDDSPKHPSYARPAAPARRRNRRGQGAAQASTAEETERPQPETPRLF